jgi:hypothetical protein
MGKGLAFKRVEREVKDCGREETTRNVLPVGAPETSYISRERSI